MDPASPHALPFNRYREVLDREYRALADLVPATLDLPVPGCPGWTGEDLARHTAIVFLHKAETIRTGERPSHGWPPVSIGSLPPRALLDHSFARLTDEFDRHRPEDPAETFVPGDQTVGFWIRRLTHETAIHRVDLEDTAGRGSTRLDPDLTVDGIDEVLTVMLVRSRPDRTASGAVVRLEAAGHSWDVRLDPGRVGVTRDATANGHPTVRADPEALLLWLWGRAPHAVPPSDAARELRARLARAL
ncbi:maleylpyruvate isomerase family mycothiol-dependent enzyme [Arthrobacter sp. Ld5]|uniref:maleylpyruvate isomerase family mycothiol-dependent enzyme n=1 Tax=Arthrobacter sp. Ld5 TaxID=649152 RepID=UPI003EBE9F26